jgi:hypothetical protein
MLDHFISVKIFFITSKMLENEEAEDWYSGDIKQERRPYNNTYNDFTCHDFIDNDNICNTKYS